MSITFSFLIKDSIHKESFWQSWLNQDDRVIIHAWGDDCNVTLPHICVDKVWTSWEQTMLAHIQLFKEFLKEESSHLVLLSESCIPCCTREYFTESISVDKSYFSRYGKPWWQHPMSKKGYRWIPSRLIKYALGAEQWCILCRRDVEMMVNNIDWLIYHFSETKADNEVYLATTINHFHGKTHMIGGKHWDIDWKGQRRHPKTYSIITQEHCDKVFNNSFFLRKITQDTDISVLEQKLLY